VALTGEPVYFENESRELGKHFAVAAFRFGPNQFACSFTDVSDRKHAERSLQERNEQLSNALRIARLGHWVLDIESGMFTFTDNFYEIFHATAEAVGGYRMSIADYSGRFVHPEDAELVTEEMQKAVESDDPNYTRYVEHRILFADGGVGHIAVKFFIIKNEDEKIFKIYGFNQDITERKQAEKERERLQEQLSHAQKIDSVGRLAGGVAHDFNNMLGVILGHTELAMEQIGPNEQLYTSLEEIQRAAERSANLTRQLLAYARRQAVAPKVVDLNETVQGMLKMLRRLIGEDVDLAWLPGANLCPIYIDPSQIDQILANLCVNARDAISGTGTITIETDNAALDKAYSAENSGATPIPGEYVLLAVSDDGCGLDTETRNRLFEPFFTTKAIGKGTGLGLATVYGIVKQNNGIINVYSEPGHGTTFKIYLPCNATKAAPQSEQQQPSAQASGSETILLVEDEPAILKITTQILETIGYAVIAAGTPGEAIRLAREHKGQNDLLITDVVMPEMNGRDLARNLLTIYPDIKRLFMSGYTANIIAHHGVLDDGVHFIQKPFSKNDLAAKTEEALKG
jgi:PAS domain S-box-containing protein